MRVVILGAGTAIPAAGHSPAGIFVEAGGERLLLDAGPGTLQRLHAAGAPFRRLDRIFLTHFHLDHCLDLASILFALRLPQLRRRAPLTVYGPRGLRTLYRRLNRAFHGWIGPRGFRLVLKELGQGALRLPGCAVETRRMRHYQTGAIGYRLTAAGKSLAYSGDTDACDGVIELGRRADCLVLECSVTDERKVPGHLTPSECGRIAAAAGCRRLVLTHFYPVFKGYDVRARVRRSYRGPLTLARDFTALTL
jgi:ribonuclease BN (tRNA processing enzyme)